MRIHQAAIDVWWSHMKRSQVSFRQCSVDVPWTKLVQPDRSLNTRNRTLTLTFSFTTTVNWLLYTRQPCLSIHATLQLLCSSIPSRKHSRHPYSFPWQHVFLVPTLWSDEDNYAHIASTINLLSSNSMRSLIKGRYLTTLLSVLNHRCLHTPGTDSRV